MPRWGGKAMAVRFTLDVEAWARPLVCYGVLRWLGRHNLALVVARGGRARGHDDSIAWTALRGGAACAIGASSPMGPAVRAMSQGVLWHGSRLVWLAAPESSIEFPEPIAAAGMSLNEFAVKFYPKYPYSFNFLDGDILCYGDGVLDDLSSWVARLEGICKVESAR